MTVKPLCTFPWHYLTITSHGYYQPCCYLAYECVKAPRTARDVAELFNSQFMRTLRRRLVSGDLEGLHCQGCSARLQTQDDFPAYPHMTSPAFSKHRGQLLEAYRTGQNDVPLAPLLLELGVTRSCNLRCRMCHITHEDDEQGATVVGVDHFLGLLADTDFSGLGLLRLLGGEIFFAKDGLKVLDFLLEKGMGETQLEILTNGVLLDKYLDRLRHVRHLKLTFSIDGHGQAYESIRIGGKWERLTANLKLLNSVRADKPGWEVRISSLIMRSSIASMEPLVRMAAELNYPIVFHKVLGHLWDENPFVFPDLLDATPWRDHFDKAVAAATELNLPDVAKTLAESRDELAACLAGQFSPTNVDVTLYQELTRQLQAYGKGRRVILFGLDQRSYSVCTGSKVRELGLEAIVETDPHKIGHRFFGVAVHGPDYLLGAGDAVVVCLATAHYRALKQWMERTGLCPVVVNMSLPASVLERCAKLAQELGGRPVVLYGAGGHTVSLLDMLNGAPLNLAAIADRNVSLHGQTLGGAPVIAPENIMAFAQDVLISSGCHEGQIVAALKERFADAVRIHTLYS